MEKNTTRVVILCLGVERSNRDVLEQCPKLCHILIQCVIMNLLITSKSTCQENKKNTNPIISCKTFYNRDVSHERKPQKQIKNNYIT